MRNRIVWSWCQRARQEWQGLGDCRGGRFCCRTTAEKEGMLQDLVRFGGQRVGPAGSKKIFQILMSDDPNLCVQNSRKT